MYLKLYTRENISLKKILIIEDDKNLNKGLSIALKKDYEVFSVSTVSEAKSFIFSVDLILLDMNLPDGDGLEIIKKTRESSSIPIIVLSAIDVDNKNIDLTRTETKILYYMIKNKSQVITKELLFDFVWGIDDEFIDQNTLSVNISRIRNKLKPYDPIETVFGVGYKWNF